MGRTGKTEENVKLTKRQIQALNTKNRIYDAAIKNFNEKGFNNVSIEDITKTARVAKGSFYVHFQSKEDLMLYSYVRADAAYLKAYEESEGRNFIDRMLDFLKGYYLKFEETGKGMTKALVSSYFAISGNNYYRKDRVLVQCFEKIVEQGKVEQKLNPEIATEDYVDQLLSTLIGNEILWCFDDAGMLNLNDLIQESMRSMALGLVRRFEMGSA